MQQQKITQSRDTKILTWKNLLNVRSKKPRVQASQSASTMIKISVQESLKYNTNRAQQLGKEEGNKHEIENQET